MSITTRHRIAARLRIMLNVKGHVWAARGARMEWSSGRALVEER